MFYIIDYIIVFYEESVLTGGAGRGVRRAGKMRGVRDTGKFTTGQSWANIMEDDMKAEE